MNIDFVREISNINKDIIECNKSIKNLLAERCVQLRDINRLGWTKEKLAIIW